MPVFLVTLALLIGAAWYQFGAGYSVVPNVAGLTVAEAQDLLEPLELGAEVIEEFSEDVPKGEVINSNPLSGEKARRGGSISLIISKGKERYIIPSDLIGKDPADVKLALEELTLEVIGTNEAYDEVVPSGKVAGTDPPAGSSLKRNSEITILVSKGPAPVDVPPIIGTLLKDAVIELEKLGLSIEATEEVFDDSVAGTILSIDPLPGATVPKGTVIKATVSKGPVLVEVPNVVNKDLTEATEILEALGFKVESVNKLTVVILDKVYSQNPAAGSLAPKGSTITLEIV